LEDEYAISRTAGVPTKLEKRPFCRRKWVVEPRGIEPLTSSLRIRRQTEEETRSRLRHQLGILLTNAPSAPPGHVSGNGEPKLPLNHASMARPNMRHSNLSGLVGRMMPSAFSMRVGTCSTLPHSASPADWPGDRPVNAREFYTFQSLVVRRAFWLFGRTKPILALFSNGLVR
jgi:hypothetical protein